MKSKKYDDYDENVINEDNNENVDKHDDVVENYYEDKMKTGMHDYDDANCGDNDDGWWWWWWWWS